MYRPIVKLFAIANLVIMMLAALVVARGSADNSESALMRGDFPAFYAAGKLINTAPEKLYDPQAQAQTQSIYWPKSSDKYLYYAYPPQLALTFSILANFSPRTAQNIWIVMQLAALVGALYLLGIACQQEKGKWTWDLLLSLSILPLTIAIVAGQNTALTIFLLVSGIVLCVKEERSKQLLAGMILGLLAYKPHFMVLAATVLVFNRGRYFLIGVISSLVVQFAFIAMILGHEWVGHWLEALSFFEAQENHVNANGLVSTLPMFDFIVSSLLGVNISGLFWERLCTYVAGVCFVVLLLLRHLRNDTARSYLQNVLCFVPALIVFFSPHTMYYDFGILLISVITFSNISNHPQKYLCLLALLVGINLLTAYRPMYFGISMSVIFLVASLYLFRERKINSRGLV